MENLKEYRGLKYLTRGNASPQGRPKVYFCCHPEDFGKYFETISDEILEIQKNAAIWYYDPSDEIPNCDEFMLDLSQMQMFVIPVSCKFIYEKNQAREVEFAYAIENHIPVLPLLQESGLEEDFNRICGDLQCLYKYDNDPTAISYEEKMKKYLESVLVSDELAEKVRKAFDAYIFLSYRKKDRKYAGKIMRLIHENEFCRDIAIWYDEFLTPGEDFNAAIAKAMEKCCLFTLMVTPNLLEEANYVMRIEYPEARKSGKPILPVEVHETDRDQLSRNYSGLTEIVKADDVEAVSAILTNALQSIALRENDADPMHQFFIGLAYLSGIDVEVNHERSLALITKAADGGLSEAYKKLVSMYSTGEGVARNYETAAKWQEKYVETLEKNLNNRYEDTELTYALTDLGDMWSELFEYEKARSVFHKLLEYAEKSSDDAPDSERRRKLGVAYERLGYVSFRTRDFYSARSYYEKSLQIDREQIREERSIKNRRNLSLTYARLGDISIKTGDFSEALKQYEKSLEISKEIAQEDPSPEIRSLLTSSYNALGEISLMKGDIESAQTYYEKSFEIAEGVFKESGSIESRRKLYVSYTKLGDIHLETRDMGKARTYYEECLKISEELAKESGSISSRRDQAYANEKLGYLGLVARDFETARNYYERTLHISEELAKGNRSIEMRRDLWVDNSRLGDICFATGDLEACRSYYEKSLRLSEELAKEVDSIESRRDLAISYDHMGKLHKKAEDLDAAKSCYEKSLAINVKLSEASEDMEIRRDLWGSYNGLGSISEKTKDFRTARVYYEKGLEISRELAKLRSTPESLFDLSRSYYNLGCLDDLDMLKKAYEILEELAEKYPKVTTFSEVRDIVGRTIKRVSSK